jgi:glutamate N-acetyltransferase/amino-acid N-acetyltransferase
VSVTAAQGFVASGVHCGVKPADLDLSLVATATGQPVTAAAVFTANKMTAAPVLTSRAHLQASGGRAAAVVLNSGNANAATGGPGREHAEQMCGAVAAELGCTADEVLVCSTGLIGIPLPIDALLTGIPVAAAARRADGGVDAAEAIRTTDTFRKEAAITRGGLTVGGMAKGAAMLAPNMATMLAVLTTDAAVDHATLDGYLRAGVDASFNRLVVDGCTSTNDTVIVMASGEAGPPDHPKDLEVAIAEVCESLASQMARDAEGATKVVRLEVRGAASAEDADRGVRAIATSQLTKCSWYGCAPCWGRVASDLGSAGIAFDPDRLSVWYGGVTVARGGVSVAHDTEEVAEHMAQRDLSIVADLGLGEGAAHVLTNDLTHAYVDENMGTS